MEQQKSEQLQATFSAAATHFSQLGPYLWDPVGRALIAATEPMDGDRVLDACCGTGASAVPAAALVGSSGVVDAVDLSGSMVEIVERWSTELSQLRAHHADVTTWDSRDYDVVQCSMGIMFFPDMTSDTERLIRLARPGGRVGLTIWRAGAVEEAGRYLGRALAHVANAPDPSPRAAHLIDSINLPDTYAQWLTERGLVDVSVTVDERRLPMTPELAWLLITGSGFRGPLIALSSQDREAVRVRYLDLLSADGVTDIDATALIGSGSLA